MDVFANLTGGMTFNSDMNAKAKEVFQRKQSEPVVTNKRPLDFFGTKKSADGPSTGQSSNEPDNQKRLKHLLEKVAPVKPVVFKSQSIKVEGDALPALDGWGDHSEGAPKIRSYLRKNIESVGYANPSPVQKQVIPCIIGEREVLVAAPTGSGKTAAYCIPLLHVLKKPQPSAGVRALLVLPTKELTKQVETELLKLSVGKPFRIVLLTNSRAAKIQQKMNADILITTPGPLQSLLLTERGGGVLSSVEHLILDESDKLLSDEFVKQMDDILAAASSPKRRIYMLSATMMPHVEALAKTVMHSPVRIIVGAKNAVESTIDQQLVYCGSEKGKLFALKEMIRSGIEPPVLLFVQSKDRAQQLYDELVFEGINVGVLTGAKSEAQRAKTVQLYREGKLWFLIATNLLSRGLDFAGVNLVINYDLPQSPVDYIHRVGRTGRMGRKGKAITYYSDEDLDSLRQIVNVLKQSGQPVPSHLRNIKKMGRAQKRKLQLRPVERSQVGKDAIPDFDRPHKKRKVNGRGKGSRKGK